MKYSFTYSTLCIIIELETNKGEVYMEQILSEVLEGIAEWKMEVTSIAKRYEKEYQHINPEISTTYNFKIDNYNNMDIHYIIQLYFNDNQSMVEESYVIEVANSIWDMEEIITEILDRLFKRVIEDAY